MSGNAESPGFPFTQRPRCVLLCLYAVDGLFKVGLEELKQSGNQRSKVSEFC